MFADIRRLETLFNDVTPTVSKYWEGPGKSRLPLCSSQRRFQVVLPLFDSFVRKPLDMPILAVEMPSYTNAEMEAYSCVAENVACNAAPAVPSPADAWSGTVNNP